MRQLHKWGAFAFGDEGDPVAWREIDYPFPPAHDAAMRASFKGNRPPFDRPNWEWNYEQTIRRALRSLERRGLVELGRYCFRPNTGHHSVSWCYVYPDNYHGEGKVMIGARLTEAGHKAASALIEEDPRT